VDVPDPDTTTAPLHLLARLHTQLRLLVPVLVTSAGTTEVTAMLAGLRESTARVAALLAVAEPAALDAIRSGLALAADGMPSQAGSELLNAHRRLGTLLQRDQPRRAEAAHERTMRWQHP
jgi:hypothetical protein